MNANAKILIIDSDSKSRQMIASALREDGFWATEKDDLSNIEKVMGSHYDVVIIDPSSVGGNLVHVITSLRSLQSNYLVSIVVCSSDTSDDVMIDLLNAGADDYVFKPVSPITLKARVRSLLRRQGYNRAL